MTHPSNKILVAYDSRLGSTREVAGFIGDVVGMTGASVDIKAVSDAGSPKGYDLVIVGSAIRYDRWLPEAVEFLRLNRTSLSNIPTALFFTCLTLAKVTPETTRKADDYSVQLSGLVPELEPISVGRFGGVLNFRRGPWSTRLLLRVLSIAAGVKEGDYRDWQDIRAWTHGLLARLDTER